MPDAKPGAEHPKSILDLLFPDCFVPRVALHTASAVFVTAAKHTRTAGACSHLSPEKPKVSPAEGCPVKVGFSRMLSSTGACLEHSSY